VEANKERVLPVPVGDWMMPVCLLFKLLITCYINKNYIGHVCFLRLVGFIRGVNIDALEFCLDAMSSELII
jgi:hypothetical protein